MVVSDNIVVVTSDQDLTGYVYVYNGEKFTLETITLEGESGYTQDKISGAILKTKR